ncbi:SCO1431 family membrane protein [Streptomyces sp. TRM64462]|uniref:SCO1431 family membrane protein n=1 Tax=Streptomyces sp. TRM64462 TaxID=2741726 RepID=UPI00158627F7|nr:SCO1431 family membrane protein [Streptomyces sp. TRM64462]
MTAAAATVTAPARARSRTGGPKDDGPGLLEHALGWVLVIAFAVLVTRLGLL